MAAEYERRWETKRGGRSKEDRRNGFQTRPDERNGFQTRPYYDVPPIHKPHWKWLIIVYFFLGGIAGASYVIASVAQLVGGADMQRIKRVGRYISLAALLPSPILLILDLGRPDRFHHMLRVLKLRSPMSVGTWVLSAFGACCGLSALIQAAEDGLLRCVPMVQRPLLALPSRVVSLLGMPLACGVSGYTGILVAATAVPLWAKNYLLLGPLFLASACTNATAAITLVLSLVRGTRPDTLRKLERLDLVAIIAELVLLVTMRVQSGAIIGRPLREGHLGRVYRWFVLGAGISAPLLLVSTAKLVRSHRLHQLITPLAAVLSLIGGQSFRYLIVMAGRESADDPQATFEFTRKA